MEGGQVQGTDWLVMLKDLRLLYEGGPPLAHCGLSVPGASVGISWG